MIEIKDNQVIITINGTYLVQKQHSETGAIFQNETDCFNWIVDSGWFERFKQAAIEKVKAQTSDIIYRQAPNFKQINAALGLYDTEECDKIIDIIAAYRSQADTLEANILAATTLDEIKTHMDSVSVIES